MWAFCALTVVATAALLAAEYVEFRPGVWVAKPVASTGFIGAAVAAGALDSAYGKWVLLALALSWLGDVFLIPRGAHRVFMLGLVSFLLGHVAYAVAFLVRGVSWLAVAFAGVAAAVVLVRVQQWLDPHVGEDMRGAVHTYMGVISLMVMLAVGTTVGEGNLAIAVGAVLFYLSDLAVARQRFVVQTFLNPAWGLPLYYLGQLVLATTVP